MERGIRYNLGLIEANQASADVRAERLRALSALLPQLEARARQGYENLSYKEIGLKLPPIPGLPALRSTSGGFHVINDFGLERPQAVGPDIGTSTLLFAAAKHPSLLRSIVLGNGTAAVPIQVGGVLNDIVGAPDIEPFRKIDPRQGVDSVLAFVERYKLPEHVREDFLSAYEGDRFVESLRFLQAYKTELPKLGKLLPTIMTPVQIITRDHAPRVLPVNGDYLHEQLLHNKYDKINAGHFPWADVSDEYAGLIIDWWKGGYERASGGKA